MGSELGVTASSKLGAVYSPVSEWWASWAVIWTVAVVSGMVYLIKHRHSPVLRIRGLGLSLSAITFLHLYWTSVQFGVMAGTLVPGDAEYWLMGTWLPIGVALFHASNTRFLHVAKMQKKYIQRDSHLIDSPPDCKHKPGLINRFRRLSYNTKLVTIVVIGCFVQIFLTILMWVISRRFHDSWGIAGTEIHGTAMEKKAAMGTGWEWWPGVAWQFIWSWVVAPIVLWKSRNIHDTQGWRVQTIGCAIANLPATPMWLIGLYVPAMAPVNAVWLPPQWIGLSIIFTEIFTVFLPCWEVKRQQSLRQDTLDAIKEWELKTKVSSGGEEKTLNSTSTMVDSMLSGWKSTSNSVESSGSNRDGLLTMAALEYVLERNPTPLLEFSALHDFSGENIAFLTSVAEWKNALPQPVRDNASPHDNNSQELIRTSFNLALFIYAEFISVSHAEFPVNISSQELKKLEDIFEIPARILYGAEREANTATPFEIPGSYPEPPSPSPSDSSEKAMNASVSSIRDRGHFWGDIPEEFNASVFNEAEESIKYLVLTNTWPRFIKNRRTSTDSSETLHSGMDNV